MSGYIEVTIKGNCRAFLSAGSVVGVVTPAGFSADTPATADDTLTLIMSSGETVVGVYGLSANRLLFRLEGVKALSKRDTRPMVIAYLDSGLEFDAQVAALFGGIVDGEAR